MCHNGYLIENKVVPILDHRIKWTETLNTNINGNGGTDRIWLTCDHMPFYWPDVSQDYFLYFCVDWDLQRFSRLMLPNKRQETNKYMIVFSHQTSFCFCSLLSTSLNPAYDCLSNYIANLLNWCSYSCFFFVTEGIIVVCLFLV